MMIQQYYKKSLNIQKSKQVREYKSAILASIKT